MVVLQMTWSETEVRSSGGNVGRQDSGMSRGGGDQSHSGGDAYVRLKRPPLTQRPIFFHLICHSMPHDLKSWHLKKILCISP